MTNLETIPLEDGFETTLAQAWDGQLGTVNVNATPNFTFPVGKTTYIVADPGKTTMQIAEIDAYDAGLKQVTVSNVTGLEKGASVSSLATNHTVGAKIIISDNYQFWSDIQTAINSKMNLDVDNEITAGKTTFTSTTESQNGNQNVTTVQRLALTGVTNGDKVYDTDEGVNYQYIGGAWATFASGVTPNASETVAGKVEIATKSERDNETDIGDTGAKLVVVPSMIGITGEIKLWATDTPPTGWLLAQGNFLSTTTYAALFAVIGYTYGGSGAIFELPDFKGSVPVGRDGFTFNALGDTGGSETHTLTISQMPAHTHSMDTGGSTNTANNYVKHDGNVDGTLDTASAGGGASHNNLQPYLVINYIIKT